MSLFQLIGTFELGLIYALVGMGAYLSFRTLNFPDMTVDGSYVLGASVYAACVSLLKIHPLASTFAAVFAGAFAGLLTAFLATRLKMLNLLAGIITMTALYSINIRIMGKSNLPLFNDPTIFSLWFGSVHKFVPLALIVFIVVYGLHLFLKTQLGLSLRATGNNPRMARAQGIDDKKMTTIGLCLSNAVVSLAGALYAQYSGYSDVTIGVGTVIVGLAALIIGEALFKHQKVYQALLACVFGAIIFYAVTAFALSFGDFGLQTTDQKLVTAIFMALAAALPKIKSYFAPKRSS